MVAGHFPAKPFSGGDFCTGAGERGQAVKIFEQENNTLTKYLICISITKYG